MAPSQCHLMLEFEQMSQEIQTFCLRPMWSLVRLPFLSYRTLSLIVITSHFRFSGKKMFLIMSIDIKDVKFHKMHRFG